jgi:calcineurin-like phosphoesterase family protein
MQIWLTTDTHFGHQKMLEFGRPENFETKIMENIKKAVKPEDLLIHLGDFCIGKDEYWHEFYFFHTPAARNILVRGNHDRKSYSWYVKNKWSSVVDSLDICLYGKRIRLSHEPSYGHPSFDINVHGHFHDNQHRSMDLPPEYTKETHKCLAIESTNYQPVALRKFIGL